MLDIPKPQALQHVSLEIFNKYKTLATQYREAGDLIATATMVKAVTAHEIHQMFERDGTTHRAGCAALGIGYEQWCRFKRMYTAMELVGLTDVSATSSLTHKGTEKLLSRVKEGTVDLDLIKELASKGVSINASVVDQFTNVAVDELTNYAQLLPSQASAKALAEAGVRGLDSLEPDTLLALDTAMRVAPDTAGQLALTGTVTTPDGETLEVDLTKKSAKALIWLGSRAQLEEESKVRKTSIWDTAEFVVVHILEDQVRVLQYTGARFSEKYPNYKNIPLTSYPFREYRGNDIVVFSLKEQFHTSFVDKQK